MGLCQDVPAERSQWGKQYGRELRIKSPQPFDWWTETVANNPQQSASLWPNSDGNKPQSYCRDDTRRWISETKGVRVEEPAGLPPFLEVNSPLIDLTRPGCGLRVRYFTGDRTSCLAQVGVVLGGRIA